MGKFPKNWEDSSQLKFWKTTKNK